MKRIPLFGLLFCVLLAGCGGGGDSNDGSGIEGRWQLTRLTRVTPAGETASTIYSGTCPSTVDLSDQTTFTCTNDDIVEFRGNGTIGGAVLPSFRFGVAGINYYLDQADPVAATYSYNREAGQITVRYTDSDNQPQVQTFSAVVVGETHLLTLVFIDDNETGRVTAELKRL